jgi:electron transport complex protein RnfG
MREMIKMVVVLVILSSFSGGLLAAVRNSTKDKIELQQLTFVKGPAIKSILEGASNDPIVDRFKIEYEGGTASFYVGVFDGEANRVAFESAGKGFGGDLGLMVGVDIKEDKIIGVGVTTHSETPGIGSKAKTDPSFTRQFEGMALMDTFQVKTDGGQVDAITGATITSRGVAFGVTQAGVLYKSLKPQIEAKLKEFK